MINEFRGRYFFLSNFYEPFNSFEFDNYQYTNVEAAFQAQKNSSQVYKHVLQFMSGAQAKREGRRIELRSDWESVKDDLMYKLLKAKFDANAPLRAELVGTGDEIIEEGNNWHDNEWGVCRCLICQDVLAHNKLGKMLMRLRKEYRDKMSRSSQYQAVLYNDTVVINRIDANSIEVLKAKCGPWIEKDNITSIEVVKVETVGYFKVPDCFK